MGSQRVGHNREWTTAAKSKLIIIFKSVFCFVLFCFPETFLPVNTCKYLFQSSFPAFSCFSSSSHPGFPIYPFTSLGMLSGSSAQSQLQLQPCQSTSILSWFCVSDGWYGGGGWILKMNKKVTKINTSNRLYLPRRKGGKDRGREGREEGRGEGRKYWAHFWHFSFHQ